MYHYFFGRTHSISPFTARIHSFLLSIGGLLLFSGCPKNEPLPRQEMVYQYLIDDPSTTRKGAQRLELDDVRASISTFQKAQIITDIQVCHVCQRHPDPVSHRTSIVPPEPEKRSTDYLEKVDQRETAIHIDDSLLTTFAELFTEKITEFQLTPQTDYSYIQRHLRSLSYFLGDTSSQSPRIGVISTDFINHEPGGVAALIDTTTVALLNTALTKNPHARLYVITDNPAVDKLGLQAEFSSNWTQYFDALSNLFIQPKISSNANR